MTYPPNEAPHENERRLESCVPHELMQIPRGRIPPRGVRARLTPTKVSAVIPACAGEYRYATLGRRPDVARRRTPAHEDHRWAAFTDAVVQYSATDVNRAPNLFEYPAIAPGAHVLVHRCAKQHERDQDCDEPGRYANQAIRGPRSVNAHDKYAEPQLALGAGTGLGSTHLHDVPPYLALSSVRQNRDS